MATLAAIDVGSHAVRLSVVELTVVGAVTHTEFQRWPIRLGSDAFARGRIGKDGVRTLTHTMEAIARRLADLGVDAYRAVATAAVRDAANGEEVVAAIQRSTGVQVEIISGREEGRLARDALVQALGEVPPDTLLVDLGGGSLELHRARGGWGRSVPIGTVRLLERFPALADALEATPLEAIADAVGGELERRLDQNSAPLAIGTGGNLNVLARLVPAPGGFHPGIDMRKLPAAAIRLARIPPAERVDQLGLRPDRADGLTPAALVVLALGRQFGLPAFVVPGTGLRETILRTLGNATETETRSRDVVRRLGRRLKRKSTVSSLALALFDGLAPVHGLWRPARAPLLAAASADTELPQGAEECIANHVTGAGLDERARRVAVVVALRLAGLDWQHPMSQDDRRAADVLAGLLRLAGALAERGARDISVDLTTAPVAVRAGLPRVLAATWSEPLRCALDTPLRVR
jgi:exopolyphosphatase/guanosine-5'-triphosphate,3'-diphosphate pyrophosphatase